MDVNECRVAIVADDLTGALDAAAPFAQRGATTRVVVALESLEASLDAWQGALPDVIAVTTESRHLMASAAAERVTQATRILARLAPAVWFKKIDSTLRGQAVAESLAMHRACCRRLLLAPAVPSQGRTTCDARILVYGQPLEATDFARDARSQPPHWWPGCSVRCRRITPGAPCSRSATADGGQRGRCRNRCRP
ncbi:four-carbon acid sugar kinase family protein [Halomonas sp. A40-4]|uniref:four-carbon acid sugar kinase family protein n=1 Tax=Halomonas sp. A40-4 TaxID=2785909 RepID=UPI0018EFDC36|nr:four-carbon acid sugar kinase family protein [Halomonas sp. A40-4]QPL44859.1 four-carbon acid sugar kinase family protein [Halomonas sp. A40-4]